MSDGGRIGVMGGTFDPPHMAHIAAAEEARLRFGLDRVIFMPAGQPPHKAGRAVSDAEHRYQMTRLGIAGYTQFEVSRMEIDRPGPSYTVDTLRALREELGPEAEIYFIAGADEILDIENWHEAEALPELARFVALPRQGFDLGELESKLPAKFLASIDMPPMREMHVSATDVRQRVAEGRPIGHLVPAGVEEYIRRNGLYLQPL
ncbi:MAG: nicotinate-nucleotide adenylyltransferase [Armatimonadetes bacterium]|nr:nicotinate-nucleotide adenylyltransferase [Armatimonadota bacterium]